MVENYTKRYDRNKKNNNDGQKRGTLKCAVIRNSMTRWLGKGLCPAKKLTCDNLLLRMGLPRIYTSFEVYSGFLNHRFEPRDRS